MSWSNESFPRGAVKHWAVYQQKNSIIALCMTILLASEIIYIQHAGTRLEYVGEGVPTFNILKVIFKHNFFYSLYQSTYLFIANLSWRCVSVSADKEKRSFYIQKSITSGEI